MSNEVAAQKPAKPASANKDKVTVRGLNFYYGENHALKEVNLSLYEGQVTAFIGPSGCGKSTLLRVLNRMYDLYPGQRAEGEVLLDGENILVQGPRPQSAALPRRHGVPEADAVPDDDLRQHRLRHPPVRKAAQVRDGRPRRIVAEAVRAVGRGEGQAERQRPQPLRRAAAAPVHRPHRRDQPRSDPVRRAVLGARSDLDRQDRGADRRTVRRVHDRHRHPQHAAGGARLALSPPSCIWAR